MAIGMLTQRFQDAATKAENASLKMHRVVHGAADESISTEGGLVPSLLKWYADLNDRTSGAVGLVEARVETLETEVVRKVQIKTALGDSDEDTISQKAVSQAIANIQQQQGSDLSKISMISAGLLKLDNQSTCIIKTGPSTVSIKAGTLVVNKDWVMEAVTDAEVAMPATLNAGENYGVWALPDGSLVSTEAPTDAGPYNWGSAPAIGAVLIGGFHYSLTAPATTPASGLFSTTGFANTGGNYIWTQERIDRIAGINEFSIWDLTFRPKKLGLKGFAFDAETQIWAGIYFCGANHIEDGPSKAGTNVASGTVLPKIPFAYGGDGLTNYGACSWYTASEIAQSHGCRLFDYNEFSSAMFGVTEKQSLGGPASTIPLTLRQPGYTSRIGVEQATGHQYTWGGDTSGAGGSSWVGGPNRGDSYGNTYAQLFGGARDVAANSGSRVVSWNNVAWNSVWHTGLRAACDHLMPV